MSRGPAQLASGQYGIDPLMEVFEARTKQIVQYAAKMQADARIAEGRIYPRSSRWWYHYHRDKGRK